MSALQGKGLLAERLWEIEGGERTALARRARRLGLSWLLVRLASGSRVQVPDASRARLAASIAGLLEAGCEVWGLGRPGPDLEACVETSSRLVEDFRLRGWAFETASAASDDISPLLASMSRRQPKLGLGLLTDAAGARRFTPELVALEGLCLVRMTGAGSLGLLTAALAPCRAIRPLLTAFDAPTEAISADGSAAPDPAEFLACARQLGLEGAAVASWEGLCQGQPGGPNAAAADDFARFPWPPSDPRETGARSPHGSAGAAQPAT